MADSKMVALGYIYALYNDITKSMNVACVRGCCACCTQHVTMTTLEGHWIIRYVHEKKPHVDLDKLTLRADACRFRPGITTNEFAGYCLQGKEARDEESSEAGAACLLLVNNECLIYDARPFGCRCFFSSVRCSEQTYAVVDPFILTVNTVFLQSIEHVDVGGSFGNIYDVLTSCAADHRQADFSRKWSRGKTALSHGQTSVRLAKNHPIPAFMIPPEHRDQVGPIVDALKTILG